MDGRRSGRRVASGAPVAALAGTILAGVAPAAAAPGTFSLDGDGPRLVALILLAAVFLVGIVATRPSVPSVLRAVLFWGGLALVLVAGYAYRGEIATVGRATVAALLPGTAVTTPGGQVMVSRGPGGHFFLRGEVDGTPVDFIFDTGASTVVLTAGDATAAGYDINRLHFSLPVTTANGVTQVAPIRIDALKIGSITAYGIRAAVARPDALQTSLLGNTFLNTLSGYQVSRDRLVLIP